VTGVYAPGVLALPVAAQPRGQVGYVSESEGMLTLFSASLEYGALGVLAHNYRSGRAFSRFQLGQPVAVVYGDGTLAAYQVTRIARFRALQPDSVYSDFASLDDPGGGVITAGDLFLEMYTTPGQLVFQTCIEKDGDPSWGRLFVIAERVD
jgi:hypothetical protein